MNQLKIYAQFVLLLLTYSITAQDVRLDVEGKVKIVGRVDLIVDEADSTSLVIGRGAGVSLDNGHRYCTIVGGHAGKNNTGYSNSFFGYSAGLNNTTGAYNSFFGHTAGTHNTTGASNSFFGHTAGTHNTTGASNSFFGHTAGTHNTTGASNSFFGRNAGALNTTGYDNSFFGSSAGLYNKTGTRNTFLGYRADQVSSVDSLDRAIAIGYNAKVGCSNCAVIGGTGNDAVKVGIGTSDPSQHLDVYGNIRATGGFISATDGTQNFQFTPNAAAHYVHIDVGGANNAQDDIIIGDKNLPTNKVGIGTSSPTELLDVNGNIRVRNVGSLANVNDIGITSTGVLTTSSSDARLKNNIVTYDHALDKLLAVRGVSFNWKDEDQKGKQLGVIAQEIQEHIPEVVFQNDEYLGVNYSQLSAVFIEAIKEQQRQINKYKEEVSIEINNLKEEILILKKKLSGNLN